MMALTKSISALNEVGALVMLTLASGRLALTASRKEIVARRVDNYAGARTTSAKTGSDSQHGLFGALGNIESWLPKSLGVPQVVVDAFTRAAISADPRRAWAGWLLISSLGVGGGLIVGILPALLIASSVVATPAAVLWAMRERADDLYNAGLPVLLESLARSMRSGASLRQSIEENRAAGSHLIASDLERLNNDLSSGVSLADSLSRWEQRRPLPGVRLAVAVLSLGAEMGGTQSRALDGLASTLRGELALGAEVKAQSSQARLSGLVVAASPLAFTALVALVDRSTSNFLFATPSGWVCLASGLALDAVAALWMQRIAKVEY